MFRHLMIAGGAVELYSHGTVELSSHGTVGAQAPAEHLPAHTLLNQTLNPKSVLACHPKSLLACHPKSVLAHC